MFSKLKKNVHRNSRRQSFIAGILKWEFSLLYIDLRLLMIQLYLLYNNIHAVKTLGLL